jgi:hypothetical protein
MREEDYCSVQFNISSVSIDNSYGFAETLLSIHSSLFTRPRCPTHRSSQLEIKPLSRAPHLPKISHPNPLPQPSPGFKTHIADHRNHLAWAMMAILLW